MGARPAHHQDLVPEILMIIRLMQEMQVDPKAATHAHRNL
jgi:hypothetical protein